MYSLNKFSVTTPLLKNDHLKCSHKTLPSILTNTVTHSTTAMPVLMSTIIIIIMTVMQYLTVVNVTFIYLHSRRNRKFIIICFKAGDLFIERHDFLSQTASRLLCDFQFFPTRFQLALQLHDLSLECPWTFRNKITVFGNNPGTQAG